MKKTEKYIFGFFSLAAIVLGVVSFVRWRNMIKHGITFE
jgi:hypothetical protein